MHALGMFPNDRELLVCPNCGLREDILFSGVLITYREPAFHEDTGLRFEELTEDTFLHLPKAIRFEGPEGRAIPHGGLTCAAAGCTCAEIVVHR